MQQMASVGLRKDITEGVDSFSCIYYYEPQHEISNNVVF